MDNSISRNDTHNNAHGRTQTHADADGFLEPGSLGAYAGKGNTSFQKHLRWKLTTSEIEVMEILPEMAEEMLRFNVSNRPLSNSVLKKYARQMKAGEWRLVAQPIIFSDKKLLRDGQHRLAACVESGAAFQAYVKFGEPDENFAFIDIGKSRGPSDIFAIHGVENYVTMSAAARFVLGYERGMLGGRLQTVNNVTPDELYQFFLQHPRLKDSVHMMHAFKESRLASPSIMVALHYICSKKNRALADEYFAQIADGIGITRKDCPQARLRKILIENISSARGKLPPVTIAAYAVKGWNALRSGRDLKLFKWRTEQSPDEAFPRAQ